MWSLQAGATKLEYVMPSSKTVTGKDLARYPVLLASCRGVAVTDGRIPCIAVELPRPSSVGHFMQYGAWML